MSEPLPPGTDLGRSRTTVNGYVDKLCCDDFLKTFKLSSVKALQKRFVEMVEKVEKMKNLKLIKAHRLLKSRLDAAVFIRTKAGKLEEDPHSSVSKLPQHIDTLLPFYEASGKSIATSLEMLYYKATFINVLGETKTSPPLYRRCRWIALPK